MAGQILIEIYGRTAGTEYRTPLMLARSGSVNGSGHLKIVYYTAPLFSTEIEPERPLKPIGFTAKTGDACTSSPGAAYRRKIVIDKIQQ